MKTLISKIVKLLKRLIVFLIIVELIHLMILAYPQHLFAHKLSYLRYSLHYDNPITAYDLLILNDVENRINALEIFDSSFTPRIFICQSKKLYSVFTFLTGMNSNSQGLNISLFDNTFINKNFVDIIRYYHDKRIRHSHLTGDIAQVITHEMIHNLIEKKFGWSEYRKLPGWKVEGYCEYGSTITEIKKDTNTSLICRARLLFENNLFDAPSHSKYYYRSQLLVEYLSEVKKYDFDRIFDEFLVEGEVFNEFWNWYLMNKEAE